MLLRNTSTGFGLVAIAVHWLMALAIVALFGVGFYMVDLTYYDSLYKVLPFYHKSVGIILAAVFLFRLVWRLTNVRPREVDGVAAFEARIAHVVHLVFYALIAAIVVSGYLISTADGSPISVFDLFDVPATLTSIPDQEDIAGLIHEYLAYGLIALVILHAGAALKHHFVNRDDTLRRMLRVSSTNR